MSTLAQRLAGSIILSFILWPGSAVYAAITVVDDAGQQLTLAQPAQRIVSLAPNITELVFAAGAGDRLVGVSEYSDYPEAAYLFMQWLSSTRIYTWMCGNPGGYFDPMQQANFKEPLCAATYHPYSMDIIPKTIARSVPSINFAGQTALDNALDEDYQTANGFNTLCRTIMLTLRFMHKANGK